jgi:hypothetical protein
MHCVGASSMPVRSIRGGGSLQERIAGSALSCTVGRSKGEAAQAGNGQSGRSTPRRKWMEFCDLASVARGEIPKDLVSDDAILGRLPVLFQTLRDSGADSDKLDQLVEKIR